MKTGMKRTRTVRWEDPFIGPQAAAGRSGLEILKDVFEGRLPPPPIAQTMGFMGVHIEEGKAVFEGEPGEHLYNPIGVVHGGFAMALLDSAMGCSVHSTLAAGDRYTTLEVKTNLVRPITVDTSRARCEGVVVHRGSTIATADATLFAVTTGKRLAHPTRACSMVPATRPST